ncbi:MAG TPA: PAS domain S-box protein [Pseudolabrys sp.]|nr:PAS domain S-box protein [Pseudolabrys sp.]
MQKSAKAKHLGAKDASPAGGMGNFSRPQKQNRQIYERLPELQLIYDTAPVGLAFLTLDCRYVQINHRLTEICGISVADHIGRSVRDTVPAVADQVEQVVNAIVRTGEPITGIEVRGQKADKSNADHVWITNWHPLKTPEGKIVGINVVAEDITERKRAEAVLAASEHALRESEARFRELADNISQFAWTADTEGRRNWYNKRWYDYSGTTLEEMQGFGWKKLHHPDHLERVFRHIRECFKSDEPWEDIFPLRGRDGNYRWFLSRAQPIRDEAGKVVRWFGTNTDITDQLEAENALRELNETLEERVKAETHERLQIWNVSQDLLLVADLDGKYLSVNPAWTSLLGWSEQELLGKDSFWLVHPDDREKIRAEAKQLAAGEMTQRFEVRFRRQNGTYRWLLWKAVQDQSCIYAMAADVTSLKDAEEKLRHARQELAQVARRVSLATMSAAIAHEIRQPLGAIVTNANAGLRWLDRPQPDLDEVRDSLRHIVGDGHRASEVIQSVRAMFTKGEHPGTPLDANDLIRETISMATGDLGAGRVVVDFELADKLPLITAHKGQLQQVILNIVSNAIDSMRTIDDRVRMLRLRSKPFASNGIAVSVQDSGTGIDPQNVDRIFDAFFSTKTNGMGMGLAICRSIVEAHGGRLSVSAGVPHGSIFHIVLPGVQ